MAHEPMYMKDWLKTQAIDKAHAKYEKYRKKQEEQKRIGDAGIIAETNEVLLICMEDGSEQPRLYKKLCWMQKPGTGRPVLVPAQ